MEIKQIKLSELKAADYNPRLIDIEVVKRLEENIKKFGYIDPIIWNKQTGNIVGGHARWQALKNLKKDTDLIDVVIVDMPLNEEKILNISLNKISGEWDDNLLTKLLGELNLFGVDLNYTGFDKNEVTNILNQLNSEEYKIPELIYDGLIGEQSGMSYPYTFYFRNEKDYKNVKDYFGDNVGDIAINKLLELINDGRKKKEN